MAGEVAFSGTATGSEAEDAMLVRRAVRGGEEEEKGEEEREKEGDDDRDEGRDEGRDSIGR